MLNLMPMHVPARDEFSRRDLLRMGTVGGLGMTLPQILAAANNTPQSIDATRHQATAKRSIYIFLCGGPSQLDMWDPKPDAPSRIRGQFGDIATSVPGTRFGALLPNVATHADKLAIVRSMNVGTQSHDIGIFRTLLANRLGTQQNKPYPVSRNDHPAIGAILHRLLGTSNTLPPWVVVPRHFTTGPRFYKGQRAGFLGPRYEPLSLGTEKTGSLDRSEFTLKNLELHGEHMTLDRLDARRSLLAHVGPGRVGSDNAVLAYQQQYDKAIEMLTSVAFREAFDVTHEPMALRQRYGMNEYGQSFLLARRLVERDVRLVNVFWTYYGADGCQFNLWDNHGTDKKTTVCGGINRGKDMLSHKYCLPSFDAAFSTLLDDLDQRGLLDDTLVTVIGEFGRTPTINKHTGRDHWGACYSAVLAGGGIRGGHVHGASDSLAAYVRDLPVSVYDFQATILHAFGLKPEAAVPDDTGRPVRISDGQPVLELF